MRPRKPVLVWAEDADMAADLAYVLNTGTSFKASVAASAADFLCGLTIPDEPPVVVLFTTGTDAAVGMALFARSTRPEARILGLPTVKTALEITGSVDRWLPASCSRAKVIDAIHVLAARKRGPAKGTPRPMPRTVSA